MKRYLSLIALCFGLAAAPAFAADNCAWSGGDYSFSEHGIYADFTVNGDCTEMVWSRLSDGPETAPLQITKNGWKGRVEGRFTIELLKNGHNLRLTADGGVMRQTKATRKN